MRLIDADTLIEWFRPYGHLDEKVPFDVLLEDINAQPTIDAEPVRHGRWIMRGGKRYCSYCNKRACVTRDREDFWYTVGTEYCPTCGAKMDGGVSNA